MENERKGKNTLPKDETEQDVAIARPIRIDDTDLLNVEPVLAQRVKEDGSPADNPKGFVMSKSPKEIIAARTTRIGYIPSKSDKELFDEYAEHMFDNDQSLYELTEDGVLRTLRGKKYQFRRKDRNDFYVSDGVGDDYEAWNNDTAIFISAQTGRGKNTFIESILIPYVKGLNYRQNVENKILMLSNRIALNSQIKRRLENTNIVKVLSYQSLVDFVDYNKGITKYKYVICDECHFFTSDAMFNPETASILERILREFQHAVRIYMSSTFCDCLKYIFDYEERIHRLFNQKLPRPQKKAMKVRSYPHFEMVYYSFERDYSYLDIRYYSDYLELYDIILSSVSDGEKWLLFIDNKKKCQDLKQELLAYSMATKGSLTEKDILLIDATSKEEAEYTEFVDNEKFKQKILISTSVIDNGVNIDDRKLKHVVISHISKDKCLQMIGRKRLIGDERVTLYVKKFDIGEIREQIEDFEERKEAYHLYSLGYCNDYDTENSSYDISNARSRFNEKYYNGAETDFKNAKQWFYRDDKEPERVLPNDIAVSLVDDVLLPRYRYILKRMEETGSGQEFLEQQLSWFGQAYDEDNDVSLQNRMAAVEDFNNYIAALPNRRISKEDKPLFKIEFFKEYNKAYGYRDGDNKSRTPKDGYGVSIINKIFVERGIDLEVRSDKEGWVVGSRRQD